MVTPGIEEAEAQEGMCRSQATQLMEGRAEPMEAPGSDNIPSTTEHPQDLPGAAGLQRKDSKPGSLLVTSH